MVSSVGDRVVKKGVSFLRVCFFEDNEPATR